MFMTGESMLDGALNGKLRQGQRRAVSDAFAVTCRIDRRRTNRGFTTTGKCKGGSTLQLIS